MEAFGHPPPTPKLAPMPTPPPPPSIFSFSALPTGPQSTVVLYLTEADLAQLLGTHAEMMMKESEIASDAFWRGRCCNTFGRHVGRIQGLGKDAFRAFLTAKAKRCLPHYYQGGRFHRFRCVHQLLTKCLGASSQDMDDEKPSNTLVPSPCAVTLGEGGTDWEGKLRQTECGCVFWSKCYWSSEPSAVADKDEWIQYDLVDGLAVVSSFVLTPYTSFWQPDQPTYNPVEACFQLTHPQINGGEKPYYESPRFRVDGSMKRQQFDLPQPILSLGGRAKVVLLGMAQRQTLPETVGETANHYHVCISYASLMGTVLLSCGLAKRAVISLADRRNDGSSSGTGGGEGVGGRSAVEGGSIEGGESWVQVQTARKKQQDLRLQWVVEVFVYPVDPMDRVSRQAGKGEGEAICDSPRHLFKIKAFSDTPCLQFVKLYAPLVKSKTAGDVRLMLASDSGGEALPVGEGVVLGSFAVEGRLDLVDATRNQP